MDATAYDQAHRYLGMQCESLGPNDAILTELEGEDILARTFSYRIRFASEAGAETIRALLGTAVTLQFGIPGAEDEAQARRPLHGLIRRMSSLGGVPHRAAATSWEAEVVPRLWFLSLASDFRVFQDMTIPDIITEVLNDHGLAGHFAFRPAALAAGHGTLEYCVQYNETALAFVSRLMEQAGLFYWHEHSENDHKLIISDDNSFARVPSPPLAPLSLRGDGWLTRFDEHLAVRSGSWMVRDHNLLKPDGPIDRNAEWGDGAGAPASVAARMQQRERILYPGNYMARVHASSVDFGGGQSLVAGPDATTMSNLLIEVEESNWRRYSGESRAAILDAGTKVRIDPDNGSPAADYLVTSIRHHAADYSHWTSEMWEGREPIQAFCTNSFTCQPFAVPFRPERVTPKPAVQGPQTAIVTGPPGEEIHTDKYGRVKLRFPWDRADPPSPDAGSCWVRVSQGWGSNGWGQVFLPRVGDEVVVDFLNGDPDRPIVTGRVYNVDRMPPHTLPANRSKSGLRTRSYPGGTSDNYNELMFDDAIGSEQVLLHAEKDYTVEVENNETRTIGIGSKTGNRTTTIKNDETTTIGGNKSTTVTGDFTETIGGSETRTVTGDVTETFNAGETRTIMGDHTETVLGSVTQVVTGDISVTTPASITLTAPSIVLNTPQEWFQVGLFDGGAYLTSVGFTGAEYSVTGSSVGATGIETSVTGLATGVTGMAIDATGVSIGTTGVGMEMNGITISLVGVSIGLTGVQIETGLKVFE